MTSKTNEKYVEQIDQLRSARDALFKVSSAAVDTKVDIAELYVTTTDTVYQQATSIDRAIFELIKLLNANIPPQLEQAPPVHAESDFLLQFFGYSHLPEKLKQVSRPFCELALVAFDSLPDNEERHVMLRKLLEAKDCAVRAELAR